MTIAGEPAATEPKYYAVKRHLLEFIGSLDPGAPVPTERELATQMHTSRTTVRQALGRARRRGAAGAPSGIRHLCGGAKDHVAAVSRQLYRAGRGKRVQALRRGDRDPPDRRDRRACAATQAPDARSRVQARAPALRRRLPDRRRDLVAAGRTLPRPDSPDPRPRIAARDPRPRSTTRPCAPARSGSRRHRPPRARPGRWASTWARRC